MAIESHHDIFKEFDDDDLCYEELGAIDPVLIGGKPGSNEDELRYRMLYPCALPAGFNQAFSELMQRHDGSGVDLIVTTANSAVPVADSVRGWYDVTGGQAPEITYIRANRELSVDARRLTIDQCYILDNERQRLAREYADAQALVIDQYIHTGSTLRLARQLLQEAGIAVIGDSDGALWYYQAHGHIDLRGVTSEHAVFMRNIGREAVQAAQEDFSGNWH